MREVPARDGARVLSELFHAARDAARQRDADQEGDNERDDGNDARGQHDALRMGAFCLHLLLRLLICPRREVIERRADGPAEIVDRLHLRQILHGRAEDRLRCNERGTRLLVLLYLPLELRHRLLICLRHRQRLELRDLRLDGAVMCLQLTEGLLPRLGRLAEKIARELPAVL